MILLVVAWIIQFAVWNPPPDIRWNGSIGEWPIPWMVCCGSVSAFASVLFTYLFAWICLLAIAPGKRWMSVLGEFALLCAIPVSVYALYISTISGF
ncbi:MAG: hypothetical protein AAGI63_05205 [Planctomycetota bacterium]